MNLWQRVVFFVVGVAVQAGLLFALVFLNNIETNTTPLS